MRARLGRAHVAPARAARDGARTAGARRLADDRLTHTLRAHDSEARWTGFVTSPPIGLTKRSALKQVERIS
ncbi:hypothetical protein C6T60_09455 [Burkholderia multivorans]|nr:hypothetical protein C6T60_09455 [Burkholderia multivorans]